MTNSSNVGKAGVRSGRDFIRGPIADIAIFLAELFEEGYQYQLYHQFMRKLIGKKWVNTHYLLVC